MSELEQVIFYSRKIESLLEQKIGATGKGLHEKVTSIESKLDQKVVKKIRWIATIRNGMLHEDGYKVGNFEQFIRDSEQVVELLEYDSHRKPITKAESKNRKKCPYRGLPKTNPAKQKKKCPYCGVRKTNLAEHIQTKHSLRVFLSIVLAILIVGISVRILGVAWGILVGLILSHFITSIKMR